MTVGIVDSGIGGLTVLKELISLLPDASFIYLADTENFPYGEKSPDEIIRYSLKNVSFLMEQQIDLLVVACHTISTVAIEQIEATFSIPVINITDCLVHAALPYDRMAILGTQATIESNVIQNKLNKQTLPIACPELVRIIEQGNLEDAKSILEAYGNLFREHGIETILFACTHFPLLLPLMKKIWGEEFRLIDPAPLCANQIFQMTGKQKRTTHQFFVSDNERNFDMSIQKLLPSFKCDDFHELSFLINLREFV